MDLSRLDQVSLLHGLQDMFARLRIVDEGVTLGAVYELEVLSPELAEDRFRRHGERVPVVVVVGGGVGQRERTRGRSDGVDSIERLV